MGSQASGGELLTVFFFCAIGFGILYLILFIINGGKTISETIEEDRKKEEKEIERTIESGPSEFEKYQEARRLYYQAHPMMCEIVKRSKREILQMVLDPKRLDIRITRDLYRLGDLFGFTIPELKRYKGSDFKSDSPFYYASLEENRRKHEDVKRTLGISSVYDDPLASSDPYEPREEFFARGHKIAQKYGYYENDKPNIFKTNKEWWDNKKDK